jgi:hypothetical protein
MRVQRRSRNPRSAQEARQSTVPRTRPAEGAIVVTIGVSHGAGLPGTCPSPRVESLARRGSCRCPTRSHAALEPEGCDRLERCDVDRMNRVSKGRGRVAYRPHSELCRASAQPPGDHHSGRRHPVRHARPGRAVADVIAECFTDRTRGSTHAGDRDLALRFPDPVGSLLLREQGDLRGLSCRPAARVPSISEVHRESADGRQESHQDA